MTDPFLATHWQPPAPPPKRRGLHPVVIAGIVLACLLVMLGLGVAVVGLLASSAPHAAAPNEPSPYVPAAPPVATATTSTPSVHTTTGAPAPTKATPVPPAPVMIPDGTWTIGVDYPAGRYTATGTDGTCYWEVDRTGSNGQDIISNGTGPGNLRVTLKAGQDFHSDGCGTWVKS